MLGKLAKLPRGVVAVSVLGATIGGCVLMKDRMGGDDYWGEEKVTGKTLIVTGANSGMGKQLTQELASRGGRVIMACRDLEACEKVRQEITKMTFNRNVICKHLDLTSLKSIRAFADDIKENEQRLDVLVNNAGVMAPPYQLTEDGFESQLATNYLGPFLLTNLLLDKLKSSRPSRIINIASVAYVKGVINFKDLNNTENYDKEKAYAQSKLALILFNNELAKRLQGTDVSTYAIHPGLVYTPLGRHMAMNQSVISKLLISPVMWFFMLTPRQGIQTTLHCILDPDAQDVSGKYWAQGEVRTVEENFLNPAVAKRLWAVSEKWTRLAT